MATAGNGKSSLSMGLDPFFDQMPQLNASDLHLKVGAPMMLRIGGLLRPLDMPPINPDDAQTLIFSILDEGQKGMLKKTGSVDLAHSTDKGVRVRVNVFYQRGQLSMAARHVKSQIPTFEELMLPPDTMKKIASYESGLVVVAGATGSGKSTTLAAVINQINATRKCHILTLEDPIEYIFTDDKALINQREVGIDSDTFENALKYAMREDPDVILMGEMRDATTVQTGLTAAETGHLVFGTLHAGSSAQAIERMLDLFPHERHNQMRRSLVFNLRAVVCQKLLRCTLKDRKRIPALEIMLCTPPVRKIIGDGEDDRLPEVIQRSRQEGMIDFNQSLYELAQQKLITKQEAMSHSPNPDALQSLFDGLQIR